MRISDWSSDVCSSDLNGEMGHCTLFEMQIAVTHAARRGPDKNLIIGGLVDLDRLDRNITALFAEHRSAGLITHYAFSLSCPNPTVAPRACSGSTKRDPRSAGRRGGEVDGGTCSTRWSA